MFPLRGPIPDPSTYGINNVHKYRETTSEQFQDVHIDDGRDDVERNERSTGGSSAVAAAGVGVLGLAGVAGARRLSKWGQMKSTSLQKKALKSIAVIDRKAVSDISEIYKENGMTMAEPVATQTQVGVLTVPLAVSGAASAAGEAKMNQADAARVAAIETAAMREIVTVDDEVGEKLEALHEKEGVSFTRPTGAAAAAGIIGAGALGAAIAAGLTKSSQVKVGTVQQKAEAQIAAVDTKALSDVAAVYRENNLVMESRSPESTTLGLTTVPLGIIGAGAIASKTKMGSLDLARIANIEKKATVEIKSIDAQATDEVATIHEKEGVWFDRPGGSRAAKAAAAAGLGINAVKKIAAVENGAESQMTSIDNAAASEVIAENKTHASHMYKCAKKTMTMEFWDAEEESAAAKRFMIEERALGKIDSLDRSTEVQIAAIYQENGMSLEKPPTERGYFTARGAAGAPATAAALAAAAQMAVQRKENLANKSRSVPMPVTGDDGILHLGVYDLGAGVAAVGKAITGYDLEGPTEYDARAHWTPEQRARTCWA